NEVWGRSYAANTDMLVFYHRQADMWIPFDEDVIQSGSSDPAGTAAEHTLYWNTTTDNLWINTDGSTTWVKLGAITVAKNGSDVGTRKKINFIEGTNVTFTIADNSGSDRVDVTINASGGVTMHNLLDSTVHTDTTTGTVTRADIITGQGATPKWTRLAIDS